MNETETIKAQPKRRRRFKPEEKESALLRLRENSALNAPVRVTANELQLSERTLLAWSVGRGVAQHVLETVRRKSQTVADLYEEISVLANVRLVERLGDETMSAAVPARDLINISGISTDKARLLREQPTAINETRNDTELREKALALVERLLPAYQGNRVLALAALCEAAPTLGEYVN